MVSRLVSRWAVAVLFAATPLATAAAQEPNLAVGLKFSTLGVGADFMVGVAPRVELRGNGNFFSLSHDLDVSDITYAGDLKFKSAGAFGDVYLAGPLRLTGGIMWNGNKIDIVATPTNAVSIGDTTYAASDIGTITGKIDFRKVAPYLGLGLAGRGRVAPTFEAGVILSGSPRVDYDVSTSLTGAAKAEFDRQVAMEADNIKAKIRKYVKAYPHIGIGLRIRVR